MSALKSTVCRYRYDALDQLTGFDRPGQERLQRFYHRDHLVTELQGSSSQSVLQQGTQLLALQAREIDDIKCQVLATDQQRSVLHVTDAAGSVQQVYSPYGHRWTESGLGSVLGFNGEAVDPVTGHYLLGNGHRAFNPVLMRFNIPDHLSPFGRGGLNPYAYCLGDPVNFNDPTGRFAEIGRLIASIMSVSNTRLGMSRAIPSYNLAKDALRLGALRKLPARQAFAAVSTVTASGALLATGLVGVASAVVAIVEDPEAAAILGYVTLGLTTLAIASRVGTYWAMKKPGTEAALVRFVKNKGQVVTAKPPASSSAPPVRRGKRTNDMRLASEPDRVILKARHRLEPSSAASNIRRYPI